jgi:thiamine biosynthesis lipoprotein ApbE
MTSTLTPSSLLASRPAASQQQPADAQAQFQKLLQSIEAIYSAWSPQSRDCRFQVCFFFLLP